MKRLLTILCVLPFTLAAFAQEKPNADESKPKVEKAADPVEILKKADAATRAVEGVRYNATATVGGALAGTVPEISGTAVYRGNNNRIPKQFRIEAEYTPTGSSARIKVVLGCDGETYYLINPITKVVHADDDPAVLGRMGSLLESFVMIEYIHPSPFSDEIDAKSHELRGESKIGDEDCYQIFVEYQIGGQKAEWYFSKKDYLPRGVKRIFTTAAQEVADRELKITKLDAPAKLDDSAFKLTVPEGYTRTDEPSP